MTTLEQTCKEVYEQVHHLWLGLEGTLPTWDHKFSILYGPPVERPPLFVTGFNPGGGNVQETERSWPDTFWYAAADNPLCCRLQRIFERAGQRDAFERSTGANLIFFRTPGIDKNPSGTGWKDVPLELRRLLEQYCRDQLNKLVAAMDPTLLFVMGWDALGMICGPDDYVDQLAPGGKWLAVETKLDHRPVFAITHPSRRGLSTVECEMIGDWLAPRLTEHLGG
ncbi:MAG TPA: hypothetical protein VM308_10640 [Sphingomicrobium sp.]|nr:hypothetical protein [Sphingomicrobium sp.]